MKKIILTLLIVCLSFSLTACKTQLEREKQWLEEDKIEVEREKIKSQTDNEIIKQCLELGLSFRQGVYKPYCVPKD
jgi:hypothetical protein